MNKSDPKIPNILVTGANGFVGLHLIKLLINRNYYVRGAVRNLQDVPSDSVAVGTINRSTDWANSLINIDTVIHLAARVHLIKDVTADPIEDYLEVNLHGTVNLARQAASAGVKRFVYVSSIKVNGEQTGPEEPFTESNLPHPQDAYAMSKWQAEQALHTISNETGMEVVIVRPPLVYGPHVKANFIKLLSLVDKGIPLPLASVQNLRSLIFVGNLADAIISLAIHRKAAGQTFLVSDGEDVSTPQLIDLLASTMNRSSHIFPFPLTMIRAGAYLVGKFPVIDRLTQSLVIDSSKIRNQLGWQPTYSMWYGLRETADWYLSEKNS